MILILQMLYSWNKVIAKRSKFTKIGRTKVAILHTSARNWKIVRTAHTLNEWHQIPAEIKPMYQLIVMIRNSKCYFCQVMIVFLFKCFLNLIILINPNSISTKKLIFHKPEETEKKVIQIYYILWVHIGNVSVSITGFQKMALEGA